MEFSIIDQYPYRCRVVSKYFKEINVRNDSLHNAKIIAVIKSGTVLRYVPEKKGDFYPVRLNNGQTGYIMTKFIEEI